MRELSSEWCEGSDPDAVIRVALSDAVMDMYTKDMYRYVCTNEKKSLY